MTDLDLRPPLPPLEKLMENRGRLLVTMILREMPYEEYLKTNHWDAVRHRTFQRHGRRCYIGSGCSGPLDVHHVTYDNRGDEKPEDTIPLCRKHHQMKHDTENAFLRAQLHRQFHP